MTVKAVQSNSDASNRNSFLKPALVGGLSGYALKWLWPLTSSEMDDSFRAEVDKISSKVKEVRKQEIEEIRKIKPKLDGTDEFLKVVNKSSVDVEKLSWNARELLARVESKAEEARNINYDNLVVAVKRLRPTAACILLGMGAGLIFGFARAILLNNKSQKQS